MCCSCRRPAAGDRKYTGFLTPEAVAVAAPALAAVNIDVQGADEDRHKLRLT